MTITANAMTAATMRTVLVWLTGAVADEIDVELDVAEVVWLVEFVDVCERMLVVEFVVTA